MSTVDIHVNSWYVSSVYLVSTPTSFTREWMACRCCRTNGGIGVQHARTPLGSLGRTSQI